MCDLPKLRGINESYAWLQEQDPETQLTLKGYTILVKTGDTKCKEGEEVPN